MIRLFTAVFSALMPLAAAAETVPVRIGELGDATRLVLTLPARDGWSVSAGGREIAVTIPNATAFELPPTQPDITRIADIQSPEPSETLLITLKCDCTASSYLLEDRLLAIDIASPVDQTTASASFNPTDGLSRPWHTQVLQNLSRAPETSDLAIQNRSEVFSTLGALDAAISRGLARANYQGLLDIQAGRNALQVSPEISTELLNNITIGVQSELSTITPDLQAPSGDKTLNCSDIGARLVEKWRFQHSFSIAKGLAQSRLITDEAQSKMNADAAIDLATLLVGHGFGFEALEVLNSMSDDDDFIRTLRFIAQLLDQPKQPEQIGLEYCPEDLAFWAFLNTGKGVASSTTDPGRLMLTFKQLPPPLQARTVILFGEALAVAGLAHFHEELQDYKNTTLASYLIGSDTTPQTFDFVEPAPPRDILRTNLTERDLNPDNATPLDPTRLPIDVLDSLRVERRNTPSEVALLDAVLDLRVREDEFVSVLSLLAEAEPRIAAEDYQKLLRQYVGQSLNRMKDSELVAFAFRSDLPDFPDELRSTVSDRLLELQIQPPNQFASTEPETVNGPIPVASRQSDNSFVLPLLVEAPSESMPSFAETEALLAGSTAIRNAIETLIADTD